MIKKIERINGNNKLLRNNVLHQFVKFGIVGLSNTGLSYILYLIFLTFFDKKELFGTYDYLASSIVSFCICTVWSFYWNNKFTFKKEVGTERNIRKSFFRTLVSYSFTGLLLHNILLYLFVEILGIPKEIVPIINLVVTVPTNFVLNRYWAFR